MQGIIFTVVAIALFIMVFATWYQGLKEIAQAQAEEKLKKAIEAAGRPLVKVDVEMRGEW